MKFSILTAVALTALAGSSPSAEASNTLLSERLAKNVVPAVLPAAILAKVQSADPESASIVGSRPDVRTGSDSSLFKKAAATDPTDPVESVSTSDLDLATAAGVAKLHHRIALAARNVCAWVDTGKRSDFAPFAECVKDAIRDASPQVNAVLAKVRDRLVVVAGNVSAH